MDAPQIIAKGADHVAFKIREIAREHKIPVMENKPLARALYKQEIGEQVPEELFTAVAEVLAYVYRLKNNK
jgi:flagellar biosynthetic protein FlhB